MKISSNDWNNYVSGQDAIKTKAKELMAKWIEKNGVSDRSAMLDFAYMLNTEYGEAAAAYACQMYDEIAAASDAKVPAALPAETATYEETAKAINGSLKQSPEGRLVPGVVERLVKQAGADTILHNAARDQAWYAWVPAGGSCAFCRVLGSNGWKKASKSLLRNHAKHIHANCNCEFAISFSPFDEIEGYDPDKYLKEYEEASTESYGFDRNRPKGQQWQSISTSKINAMRRADYEVDKDFINEQKREVYAIKKEKLSQNKKDHKINITDIAINKVKTVKIKGYSTDELEKIKNLNIEVLKNAQKNNSNEVAILLDNNFIQSKVVFGDEKNVDIFADPEMSALLRNSPIKSIVLSHNHPSLSYFSADDIGVFIGTPSIKTMEIVTNNGKVWYISKNEKYDDTEILKLYKKIVKDSIGEPLDNIVEKFLDMTYNSIERN